MQDKINILDQLNDDDTEAMDQGSEEDVDLLAQTEDRFLQLQDKINEEIAEQINYILDLVREHYDISHNQELWDELLLRMQKQVLLCLENEDEDAAESNIGDIKLELRKLMQKK